MKDALRAHILADTVLNAMATPQSRMEPNKAGNATCHAKALRRLTVVVLEQCRYSKSTYQIPALAD